MLTLVINVYTLHISLFNFDFYCGLSPRSYVIEYSIYHIDLYITWDIAEYIKLRKILFLQFNTIVQLAADILLPYNKIIRPYWCNLGLPTKHAHMHILYTHQKH